MRREPTGLEIAVVGVAGRFPGADSVDALWSNLRDGVESITRFSRDELVEAGVSATLLDDEQYVRARGVLRHYDRFDAALFGYSPREAALMDPQHRLFLECAWAALEDGGVSPAGGGSSIGVFAAAGFPAYLLELHARRGEHGYFDSAETLLGNEKDHIATRVAYKLDLSGPAMAVQTACSSSLVAVHQACRALLAGDCDGALAGGVSVSVPQVAGYIAADGGALARDGHCRAFDAEASGFVPGSGVGVVYLVRLEDARAQRLPVRAIIAGSAINNDGAAKVGYTAPSVARQAEAIAAAYRFAEVDPKEVGYVEAHGAGTQLGDPIEIEALTRAFGARPAGVERCRLGSIKTNVGHLDAAAGVGGLIKVVLSLQHGEIPPSLNYARPNPRIDFAASPFRVADARAPWPAGERWAGVSSLGLGGTNAHVVLGGAGDGAGDGARDAAGARPSWFVLPLSGHSPEALRQTAAALSTHLVADNAPALDDAAYTLQVGRKALRSRSAVVAGDAADAAQQLAALAAAEQPTSAPARQRQVVLMFPGGGAQHAAMAARSYAELPRFREVLDDCAERFERRLGFDPRARMFGGALDDAARALAAPAAGLSALFSVELALARQWQSWGVEPAAMIGHSLGEYVAACLAGVLDVDDAVALVARRAQLFERLPPGAMLGVNLAAADVEEALAAAGEPELSIAAYNAPELCTVAGPEPAIARLERDLEAREVVTRRLPIDVASHCELVRPMLGPLEDLAGSFELRAPRLPYVSNASGTWITAEQAQRPAYWCEHLSQPVRFAGGLETILAAHGERAVLLEVGPGQTLTRLARARRDLAERGADVRASLPHPKDPDDDLAHLLRCAGALWSAGVELSWAALHADGARRRVSLPTYAFDRTRYWPDGSSSAGYVAAASGAAASAAVAAPTSPRRDVGSWFYLPGFAPTLGPRCPEPEALREDGALWLVFDDGSPLVERLCQRLRAAGLEAICVRAGDDLGGGETITLRPGEPAHYGALAGIINARGARRLRVVHLWQRGARSPGAGGRAAFSLAQDRGYYSLVFLARELVAGPWEQARLVALCSGTADVSGVEPLCPERVTALAPALVLPQEAPHISTRVVDVSADADDAALADIALAEACDDGGGSPHVAYRGAARLARSYSPAALARPAAGASALRRGGRYLLVGGLGVVGRQVALYLARTYGARLVLVNRTALPPREIWEEALAAAADGDDEVRVRLRAVEAIERAGAEVRVVVADVGDATALRAALEVAEREWGGLDGVMHCAAASRDPSIHTALRALDRDSSQLQLRAKVDGLYALAALLEDRPLDFCVVFSSNAAVLGGLGMTAYAASCCFSDAFCAQMRAAGRPWLSVDWDGWPDDAGGDASSAMRGGLHEYAMSGPQAFDALERALSSTAAGQLVVSSGDLASRRARWVEGLGCELPSPQHEAEGAEEGAPTGSAETPAAAPSGDAPRGEVERALAEMWSEILGVENPGRHDNFFELGGHSLLAVHLRRRVKKRLGRDLSLQAVFERGTIAGMAEALAGDTGAARDYRALVPLRASGDNPPLYLVHPASGHARVYQPLCEHLGEQQPIYAFQARGLDDDGKPFADLGEMVDAYEQALLAHQASGPYLLGGWCAGGTIAYAIGQRLHAKGHTVYLALVDVEQPDAPPDDDNETRDLFAIARTHARNVGVELPLSRADLEALDGEARLQYVLDQYKLFDVVPADMTIETMRAHWDVFLATLRAVRDYRFASFAGHLGLFLAEELDYQRLVDMEVSADFALDGTLRAEFAGRADAWRTFTPHPLDVYTVPGYHSLLALEPHVAGLAERLLDWVEAALEAEENER